MVNITPNAPNAFGIRIRSDDPASICVEQYNISLTDNEGLSLDAVIPTSNAIFNAATLFNQLCSLNYTLTVVASNGGGITTSEINIEYSGKRNY